MSRVVAVTGATGFIGGHVVAALHDAGWRTRLLLRRDPTHAAWRRLAPQVVAGSLDDAAALRRLVEGVDAVVHLAGLIKAARRADFFAVNRDGALRLAEAAQARAPAAPFLLVSSLAAREPQLSDYAASKRAGEDAVLERLGERATVLRPPVVYGPGDRETLLLFRLAGGPVAPLLGAPGSRLAMIHAEDLARLVVGLLETNEGRRTASPRVVAASDARPDGYAWDELVSAAAAARGRPAPRPWAVPQPLLATLARVGDAARAFGHAGMIHSGKLAELRHADWSLRGETRAEPPGWAPRFDLAAGFADTVAAYRRAGWLPSASPAGAAGPG